MDNKLKIEALIEGLKYACDNVIETANIIDETARKQGLNNEQFFIDWQDKLNEISVR